VKLRTSSGSLGWLDGGANDDVVLARKTRLDAMRRRIFAVKLASQEGFELPGRVLSGAG